MEDQGSRFASTAAGVFVGGLALVLTIVFWPIALGLLLVAAVGFGLLIGLGYFVTSPRFRAFVIVSALIVLGVVISTLTEWW